MIKQMQQMLYDDAPYILTYYDDNPEAYRSDRFTGFVPQPAPKGSLLFPYGTWSYENLKPVSEVTATPESPGSTNTASAAPDPGTQPESTPSSSWGLIAGIVILALVIIVVVVVLAQRRNRDLDVDDDRE